MTQLSRKAKYALRALYVLARHHVGAPTRAEDLALEAGVPRKFLETILLDLTHAGILESRRGKGGGYVLRRRPDEIVVGEVIRLIDGPLAPVPCVGAEGTPCDDCPGDTACGTRRVMGRVARAVAAILDVTTIADAGGAGRLTVSAKTDV
jgi:Rrf2 family protein